MEKFALGLIIGGIGGAVLTANNYKMRTLVRKTQEEMQAKLNMMLDERIRDMETDTAELVVEGAEKAQKAAQKAADKANEKLEEVKKSAKKSTEN
jgi:predicted Holliday junction resolvase-like endonuclease